MPKNINNSKENEKNSQEIGEQDTYGRFVYLMLTTIAQMWIAYSNYFHIDFIIIIFAHA